MKVILLALLSLFLINCATGTFRDCFDVYKPVNNESLDNFRTFKQNGLIFNVKAADYLNWYENSKHALILAIFQLRSPNQFTQLVSSDFGIRRLLEADVDSELRGDFLSYQRFAIQPSSAQQIILNRMEGTKFVGLVAGFYEGNRRLQTRVIAIPVVYRPKYYRPFFLSWLFSEEDKKPPESASLIVDLLLEKDRIADDVGLEIVNACPIER